MPVFLPSEYNVRMAGFIRKKLGIWKLSKKNSANFSLFYLWLSVDSVIKTPCLSVEIGYILLC